MHSHIRKKQKRGSRRPIPFYKHRSKRTETTIHITKTKSFEISTETLKTIIKFGIKDIAVPLSLPGFESKIQPPENLDLFVDRICFRNNIPFRDPPWTNKDYKEYAPQATFKFLTTAFKSTQTYYSFLLLLIS